MSRATHELTLAQIDKHSVELEKFDVEGILAFAACVLPRLHRIRHQATHCGRTQTPCQPHYA